MLSADMEKGGLCGRTLTLKLKTASFEVRTRAVTLQSYIWSSKDILKHASKLLKAELPVSLRLIGLRMSHFNEDKGGGTLSDPMQTTLFNFIKPGDGNREIVDEEHSDVKNGYEEAHCDAYTNPSLDQNICTSSDNNEKAADHNELEGNEYKDQIDENTLVDNLVNQSCAFNAHVNETHSLEGKKNQDHLRRIGFSDNEMGTSSSSSNHEEPFMWLDNYKCLFCGIELPPSFVEERQEHSDFHLAEKLQEEEEYKKFPLKHRMWQKESVVGQSKGKKKQKHSPSNGTAS